MPVPIFLKKAWLKLNSIYIANEEKQQWAGFAIQKWIACQFCIFSRYTIRNRGFGFYKPLLGGYIEILRGI
jgi:hypothetical protein